MSGRKGQIPKPIRRKNHLGPSQQNELYQPIHLFIIFSTKSLPFFGVGKQAHFSITLLITFFLFLSDFFGANALCMQTVVSGAYVYEYCTSNDECLALSKDSQQDTYKCLLCLIFMIRLLKITNMCYIVRKSILFVLFDDMHAFLL